MATKIKIHSSVILDRTGSMESIRDDVIGGFNTLLQEQKKVQTYGFHGAATMAFAKEGAGVADAFHSLSARITDFRLSEAEGILFIDEDWKKQKSERMRK